MKKRKQEEPVVGSTRYIRLALLFVAVIAFVSGIIGAGRWGLDQLRGRDRYDVLFADIECEPPAGMDRGRFLDEVRYPHRLPGHLHLLDEDLPRRLETEFALHPWVAKVERVQLLPPRRVVVSLKHRTPVLAVDVGGALRAVDDAGVLLPRNAPTVGLPIFAGEIGPPLEGDGKPWGDPKVEAAARKLRK